LKPWKLGGKLRMPLCRTSKVHELLRDQLVERALNAKSPFDAAGRPALLYPDLVELCAAHAATIKVGLSRTQKPARFPWHDPSARCISLTAYGRLALRLQATLLFSQEVSSRFETSEGRFKSSSSSDNDERVDRLRASRTADACPTEAKLEGNPFKEKCYFGIRYDPWMLSSRVAKTAAFAVASLLK
jgi:hypothetical protein